MRHSSFQTILPQTSLPAKAATCEANVALVRNDSEDRRERLLATFFAIGGCAAFIIAGLLTPYEPDGTQKVLGTHQQLGLPPCGFLILFKTPCPGCGMTTAFSLLVRGNLSGAWRANAAGVVIAAVTATSTLLFTLIALRGRQSRLWTDDIIKYAVAAAASSAIIRWLIVVAPQSPLLSD